MSGAGLQWGEREAGSALTTATLNRGDAGAKTGMGGSGSGRRRNEGGREKGKKEKGSTWQEWCKMVGKRKRNKQTKKLRMEMEQAAMNQRIGTAGGESTNSPQKIQSRKTKPKQVVHD